MQIKSIDLSKEFGKKVAVDKINLKIEPGKILGLLGPNGAGKSTTIKMLTGQLQPSAGRIEVDGKEYSSIPEDIRNRIGVMPQEVIVWENLNILENLQFSANLQGMKPDFAKQRADMLIKGLHLEKELKTLAKNLSGGYRRRLNLAISIIHDPEVIFLDEPTPGVDAQTRRFLWEFISELSTKHGKSVVLTDHYLDEAEKLSDYVVIIDEGKIITEGSVSDIKKNHGKGTAIVINFEDTESEESITKLRSKLEQDFGTVTKSGFELTLIAENDIQSLEQVIAILKERQVKTSSISLKEPSLEDIFILLTGKNIRE